MAWRLLSTSTVTATFVVAGAAAGRTGFSSFPEDALMVSTTRHRGRRGRAKGIMGRVSVLSTLAWKYADCRHRGTSGRKNGNHCKHVGCRAGWAVWEGAWPIAALKRSAIRDQNRVLVKSQQLLRGLVEGHSGIA